MALKRMSIKVAEELYEWISKEADKRGLTMNAVIIFALETYQNQREVIPNISVRKELMDKLENENK